MARLPTGADIARQPAPAATSGVRAPSIDFSPIAAGAKAIGSGLSAISASIEQEEAHDLDRRLLDFRLQTELDLEEQGRAMPEGGAGFTENWRQSYLDGCRALASSQQTKT